MGNVTVIGSQWGDEGKGKIVDWLSNEADVVVRFQGGNNAGHTIVVNKKNSFKPFAIWHYQKKNLSIIGNGVVVNPKALLEEIKSIEKIGVKVSKKILLYQKMRL